MDLERAAECCALFIGEHDFRNFARGGGGRTTRKVIDARMVFPTFPGAGAALDIVGIAFLWRMVRRMAAAVEAVGRGGATVPEVREALRDTGTRRSFGTAPPEPLVLMEVRYDGLSFEPVPPTIGELRRCREVLEKGYGPGTVARALLSGDLPCRDRDGFEIQ